MTKKRITGGFCIQSVRLVGLGFASALTLLSVAGCPGGSDAPETPGNGSSGSTEPVEVQEPIFVGWTKPRLAIVLTGEQHGYLEPCGCAGLGRQKGGMSRRHTLLQQLAEKGWPLAPLDLGGLSRRTGDQAEIKMQKSIEALAKMEYRAIGLGGNDLRFSPDFLYAMTAADDSASSPFVSANVTVLGNEENRFVTFEAGGLKLGVTSVLAGAYRDELAGSFGDDLVVEEPEAALAKVVPELQQAVCDQLILLSYAPRETTEALVKRFPEFTIAVVAGGPDEPPHEAPTVSGATTTLIQLGHKGMYAIVLGLYEGAPLRYQRVPLDSRFAESPEMHELMASYQEQLKSAGWEGLGITHDLHPRAQGAGDPDAQFIGSEACGKCHTQAYSVWKSSKHSHATETLTKLDPPRQFDPECISCHATGWDPKHYSPYETGFESIASTPLLVANGCENCHGPGSGHAAAERGRDIPRRTEQRAAMRLTLQVAETTLCAQCHDLDNSPDFEFKKYWDKIVHKGKQ